MVHDEEFAGLLEGADVAQRVLAWTDTRRPTLATVESLIASHDDADLDRPGAARPDRDPDLRHDRYAEGRAAQRGRASTRRSR